MGYIYIAWDRNKPDLSKVGMTTKSATSRISQTENPDYDLYKSYYVADEDLSFVEQEIHESIQKIHSRKNHLATGRKSEWFECKPETIMEIVSDYLIYYLQEKLKTIEKKYKIEPSQKQYNTKPKFTTSENSLELKRRLQVRAEARRKYAAEKDTCDRRDVEEHENIKNIEKTHESPQDQVNILGPETTSDLKSRLLARAEARKNGVIKEEVYYRQTIRNSENI